MLSTIFKTLSLPSVHFHSFTPPMFFLFCSVLLVILSHLHATLLMLLYFCHLFFSTVNPPECHLLMSSLIPLINTYQLCPPLSHLIIPLLVLVHFLKSYTACSIYFCFPD